MSQLLTNLDREIDEIEKRGTPIIRMYLNRKMKRLLWQEFLPFMVPVARNQPETTTASYMGIPIIEDETRIGDEISFETYEATINRSLIT